MASLLNKNASSHPQIIQRQDSLLLSINECLRYLCNYEAGNDFVKLDNTWILDTVSAQYQEAKELEKQREEYEEETKGMKRK